MAGRGQGAAGDRRDIAVECDDLEAAYSAEYLLDCADGEARRERLEELKRRIALGAYRVDPESLADELLGRGALAGARAASQRRHGE